MLATVADLRRGDVYSDRDGVGWLAVGDARQGVEAAGWSVPRVDFMALAECPDTGAWVLGSLPVMETEQDGAEPVRIVERGHSWTGGQGDAEGAPEAAEEDPRAAELAADVEAWRDAQTAEQRAEMTVRESVRRQMAAGLDYREVMRVTGWGKSRVYQVRDGKRT